MAVFDAWAAYYDYLHPGLPGEAEFYIGHAVKRGAPVLEVGCGTGRIAIPMALCGLKVTGMDDSREMLSLCREKARCLGVSNKALELVEADMRDFDLGRQFPLILMAYHTFMHCMEPQEQLACLRAVYRHLTPGGELFLNVWAATPALLAEVDTKFDIKNEQYVATCPVPEDDLALVHYVTVWRDDFRQLLHERHRIQVEDSLGTLLDEEHLSMSRAWFTLREMQHLLGAAGFEVEAVLGDFDGSLVGPGHSEMIWHVRRPQ